MPEALYELDGSRAIPSALTGGPWSATAQHGGPVAALLARAVEAMPEDVPMRVVRLTVELLRPVPLTPLEIRVAMARPGRRVQLVDATISANGTDVAAARALRIRRAPLEAPPAERLEVVPPDQVHPPEVPPTVPYARAVELRFAKGSWDELGPATLWTRLRVPVVAGEEPSALQRTVAAADFGNGVSAVLPFTSHVFINPDLTVSLAREPRGEWIGFDVVTRLSPDASGLADALIFDPDGVVGRSTQSLFVDGR